MSDPPVESVQHVIEAERAQIGHEIHDALLPLIFAASAGVGAANEALPPDAEQSRQQLAQVAAWLDEAMQTARRLLSGIYPPELTGTLWTRAATETLQRSLGDDARRIVWDLAGDVEAVSLPIALSAYRIVVEAVRNAIRHGGADTVTIRCSATAAALEINIQDDGIGFDPAQVAEDRFGIRSMRGRAQLVNGTLQIDSRPGGPTLVKLTIPDKFA